MFSIAGLLALIVTIYLRPHSFIEAIRNAPLYEAFSGLAVVGVLLDVRLRITRLQRTPQVRWVVALVLWSILTLLIRAPRALGGALSSMITPLSVFAVIVEGVQSFTGLHLLTGTLVGSISIVCLLMIHQGLSPFGCLVVKDVSPHGSLFAVPDGRPCVRRVDCEVQPDVEYVCERVGLLGISSVAHGRVRYPGLLLDPNKLALGVGMAVPLFVALWELRRTLSRTILLALFLVVAVACVYFTRSRSGIMVLAATLGIYVWRWYGWRGLVAAVGLFAPMVIFVLASRPDAAASSTERHEILAMGMQMFASSPLVGVGFGQFVAHYYMTAHNSYLLVLSELGLPGAFLWSGVVYVTFKMVLSGVRRYRNREEGAPAATWSLALVTAMGGLMIGSLFLSMSYDVLFWLQLGLCGAFYLCTTGHDPAWRVRMEGRDFGLLALINGALIAGLTWTTRGVAISGGPR